MNRPLRAYTGVQIEDLDKMRKDQLLYLCKALLRVMQSLCNLIAFSKGTNFYENDPHAYNGIEERDDRKLRGLYRVLVKQGSTVSADDERSMPTTVLALVEHIEDNHLFLR